MVTPIASKKVVKAQGVTAMAEGKLNHSLDLSGVASGVAKGRGDVLHCGFQAQVCFSKPQTTINGQILDKAPDMHPTPLTPIRSLPTLFPFGQIVVPRSPHSNHQ